MTPVMRERPLPAGNAYSPVNASSVTNDTGRITQTAVFRERHHAVCWHDKGPDVGKFGASASGRARNIDICRNADGVRRRRRQLADTIDSGKSGRADLFEQPDCNTRTGKHANFRAEPAGKHADAGTDDDGNDRAARPNDSSEHHRTIRPHSIDRQLGQQRQWSAARPNVDLRHSNRIGAL